MDRNFCTFYFNKIWGGPFFKMPKIENYCKKLKIHKNDLKSIKIHIFSKFKFLQKSIIIPKSNKSSR